MNLRVLLEPSDEGGFTAIIPSLPGCISEGDTRDEALANIREAIDLYLELPILRARTVIPGVTIVALLGVTDLSPRGQAQRLSKNLRTCQPLEP